MAFETVLAEGCRFREMFVRVASFAGEHSRKYNLKQLFLNTSPASLRHVAATGMHLCPRFGRDQLSDPEVTINPKP